MPVKDLWFGGAFGPIVEHKLKESAQSVQLWLSENPEIAKQVEKEVDEHSKGRKDAINDPIFIIKKDEYRVIDGNRRLLRAIVNKEEYLLAFVGTPLKTPIFYEHWVPTSLLVDLVFWHEKLAMEDVNRTPEFAGIVANLIKHSSAGRYEFENRSIHKESPWDLELLAAVKKKLN